MKPHAVIALALLAAGLASEAAAVCAPLPTASRFDTPVKQGPDCAFEGAAENDVNGFYGGRPPVDIGGGLVGQRLVQDRTGCDNIETLLVVDCTTGRLAAFSGTSEPVLKPTGEVIIGPVGTYTANLQPPKGPLRLNASARIDELIDTARKYRIGLRTSEPELWLGTRSRNRFDAFCGCKRFYPESPGARK